MDTMAFASLFPLRGTMGRAAARARPLLTAPSRYAGPIVPLKGKAYQKNFVASKAIVSIVKKPLCPLWLIKLI